jgi:hypothetical protein
MQALRNWRKRIYTSTTEDKRESTCITGENARDPNAE